MEDSYIPFYRPFVAPELSQSICSFLSAYGEVSVDEELVGKLASLLGTTDVLLTNSATAALEVVGLVCEFGEGDEVIVPGYGFVTSAMAFEKFGATPVFADVDSALGIITLAEIKRAVTDKTKAIVFISYNGIANELSEVAQFCRDRDIVLVEDAAQSIGASYDGKHLGTFGDFGVISFHETKNIHCFRGGCLIVNNPKYLDACFSAVDKGTNRRAFIDGICDRYEWVSRGGAYEMDPLSKCVLNTQIDHVDEDRSMRKSHVEEYLYFAQEYGLEKLESSCKTLQLLGSNCHLLWFIDDGNRDDLIKHFAEQKIQVTSHYRDLSVSRYLKAKYEPRSVSLEVSQLFDRSLVRLPLFFDLRSEQIERVVKVLAGLWK